MCLYLSFCLTLSAYIYIIPFIFCVLVYKKADLWLKWHVCFYTLDQFVKLYFLCILLHNLLLMSKICFSPFQVFFYKEYLLAITLAVPQININTEVHCYNKHLHLFSAGLISNSSAIWKYVICWQWCAQP